MAFLEDAGVVDDTDVDIEELTDALGFMLLDAVDGAPEMLRRPAVDLSRAKWRGSRRVCTCNATPRLARYNCNMR